MVIPRFVAQALIGQPLTIFGTGAQVRCFCHVHDVVPALLALVEHRGAYGTAVNLGSTEQVSIAGLAQRVLALTGSASDIIHMSYEEGIGPGYEDLQRRVPDCTRARKLIGFRPTRTLDDILRSVIVEQSRPGMTPAAVLG
jgi:UDP-glucose 4-epimerase